MSAARSKLQELQWVTTAHPFFTPSWYTTIHEFDNNCPNKFQKFGVFLLLFFLTEKIVFEGIFISFPDNCYEIRNSIFLEPAVYEIAVSCNEGQFAPTV